MLCLKNLNVFRQILFPKQLPSLHCLQTRGVKHKGVLQLRCEQCYFKNIDDRWYVFCNQHPRHKQVERVERDKFRYIVSERCHVGYPAFKKRRMFLGHILD